MVQVDYPLNFQNVDKRIEYISAELKRQEDSIKGLDKKQDDLRENLTNMQTQMQKLVQAWWITTEGVAYRAAGQGCPIFC